MTRTEHTALIRRRIDTLTHDEALNLIHAVVDGLYLVAAEKGEDRDPLDPTNEWTQDNIENIADSVDVYLHIRQ